MREINKNVPQIKAGDMLILHHDYVGGVYAPTPWLCCDGVVLLGLDMTASVVGSWELEHALDSADCLAVYRANTGCHADLHFLDYSQIRSICANPLGADSDLRIYETNVTPLRLKSKISQEVTSMLSAVISDDYCSDIIRLVKDEVVDDVLESADPDEWSDDDIKLSIGRVLLSKLNKDHEANQ